MGLFQSKRDLSPQKEKAREEKTFQKGSLVFWRVKGQEGRNTFNLTRFC